MRKAANLKPGSKCGSWTVLNGPCKNQNSNSNYYECKCKCGSIKLVSFGHLANGKSTNCGCRSRKNLIGQRFGKLIVLESAGTKVRGKNFKRTDRIWLCRCDCGKKITKRTSSLQPNKMSSCGCYLKRKTEFGMSSKKALFNIYKSSAGNRNLVFDIPFGEFIKLTSMNCHYCGSKPQSIIKNPRGNGDYYYNGLDRVDNLQHYAVNNVVPCCTTCNSAKSNKTIDEFYGWIYQLCKFHMENKNGY